MIHPHDHVVRPKTLPDALSALCGAPRGTKVLAGGTDLFVQWGSAATPDHVIDLWGVRELAAIERRADRLALGALATYTTLVHSAIVRSEAPALVEASLTVGAAQIQNRGTLGGNVANASPAGDTLPVLLAMRADIVVASAARGERVIPADDFWVAYRKTALAADELIVRIELPLPSWPAVFRKIGTRRAQAISKVVMCCARDPQGPARVAFGSMAPIPKRARAAEAILSAGLDDARIDAACASLGQDLTPIDDVRSTAAYRMHAARAILRRALLSLR